jgi:glycosyltransferase involved in cell wall biosynthesis
MAALLARPVRRPVVVHTYHGHSLRGYFGPRAERLYLSIERVLAHATDVLVAVSDEVSAELGARGVAPIEKFVVVPLGFDLQPFLTPADGASLRRAWGIGDDETTITLVARLVPIKRVDRFLGVAAQLAGRDGMRFVVVGDGELRAELQASEAARSLGARLTWAGFQRDMPAVYAASDVVVLTSDNEGTPVSLIEAQAAGVPVVSTPVGGVESVVRDGETGLTGADADALAAAVGRLLDDPAYAARLAAAARDRAAQAVTLDRLVDDVDALYRRLLPDRL